MFCSLHINKYIGKYTAAPPPPYSHVIIIDKFSVNYKAATSILGYYYCHYVCGSMQVVSVFDLIVYHIYINMAFCMKD